MIDRVLIAIAIIMMIALSYSWYDLHGRDFVPVGWGFQSLPPGL